MTETKTKTEIIDEEIQALKDDILEDVKDKLESFAGLLNHYTYSADLTEELYNDLTEDIKPLMNAVKDFVGIHKPCFMGCDCERGCKIVDAYGNLDNSDLIY